VLDYLPPYSHEPSPIERVWKLTRRQWLHNFPVLEEVVAVVETQLEDRHNGNETLRRLCAIT
jgi:transposase